MVFKKKEKRKIKDEKRGIRSLWWMWDRWESTYCTSPVPAVGLLFNHLMSLMIIFITFKSNIKQPCRNCMQNKWLSSGQKHFSVAVKNKWWVFFLKRTVTCNVQSVRNIIKNASSWGVHMGDPIYEMYNIFIFYI